ncbi:MAG: hypothetical protein CML18_11685 [Pusillimonas sp.]|nr:hypothetical protein [Pusillimonas sp.]
MVHRKILQEFYLVAFRRKIYRSLEEVQLDLDCWIAHYNNKHTYQGKMCCGRTPIQTLVERRRLGIERYRT